MSEFIGFETKDLADAKLPNIFICNLDGDQFQVDLARKYHGYFYKGFFLGEIEQSTDFLSWEGTQNITYEKLLRKLFTSLRPGGNINGKRIDTWGLHQVFLAFNGFCSKLKLPDIENGENWEIYVFDGYNFQVFIEDPDLALLYTINSNSLFGDFIEFGGIGNYEEKYYSVSLEEINWLEESGECTNYGEASTYMDCIANEQKKIFEPILGCMVPWLVSADHPNICRGRIANTMTEERYQQYSQNISKLYYNRRYRDVEQYSNCLKPCKEIKAYSKLKKYETRYLMDISKEVHIRFDRTVKVTTYLKAFGLFDLVVEVGSSLGLWIGLSALGVFDLILQAGNRIMEKN